jgi:CBS domain-containing protein
MYPPKLAQDIMVTDLVTFSPSDDVFDAIQFLLKRQITGGPVIDSQRNYLGVFSEKRALTVLTRIVRLANDDGSKTPGIVPAGEFMTTKLITLSRDTDVFQAIGHLLKNHISGAPVVDTLGTFLGVFSEKTSMSVLIQAAYEQLPATEVGAFMNTDPKRAISEQTDLLRCAEIFLQTPYRRLPVLRDKKLIGQVSRRDVIASLFELTAGLQDRHALVIDPLEHVARNDSSTTPGDHQVCTLVREFMDTEARTIHKDTDLLTIAHLFLHTPYRRLPVVEGGKLVGQVSRRDVLEATHRLMEIAPTREKNPMLYLSALVERHEAPIT